MQHVYSFSLQKIEQHGWHPFITFYENGNLVNSLIDSGSSCCFRQASFNDNHTSSFDGETAAGMGNNFPVQTCLLNEFLIGNGRLKDFLISKTNLSGINNSLVNIGIQAISGILGCDVLHLLDAEIDFRRKQLFLKNHAEGLPFVEQNSDCDIFFPIVSIPVQSKKHLFIIDTGASQTVLDESVANILFSESQHFWEENDAPSIGISPSDILMEQSTCNIAFEPQKTLWKMKYRILKMNHINGIYQKIGMPEIQFILGCDFFTEYAAVISFANKCIFLAEF